MIKGGCYMNYTREDIERIVEEEDVEFIRLQFTDIFGKLKNVAITRNNLSKALDGRFVFDGTYIDGFDTNDENDMILVPDLRTFEIFPWRPQAGKVARLICDIRTTDGNSVEDDSRAVLKRELEKLKNFGYTASVGPECEFFLFQTDDMGRPTTESTEDAGYFDLGHSDLGENVRRDMVFTLEDMDFDIESSYHEKAAGQHEIDFKYVEALHAADDIITLKLAVQNVAKKHGLLATFMPKPVNDVIGSGMHLNLSLSQNGHNVFYDKSDENQLSELGYHFIAGILTHLKSLSIITNPIVNSYKRLSEQDMIPNHIAYAASGKRAAIRIPYIKTENSARIELKSPDTACNPYLAIACVLAAGFDGIERKLDADEFMLISKNNLSETQHLPGNLEEAIQCAQDDDFLKKIIGESIFTKYIKQKKEECYEYNTNVSQWEIDRYLTRI